jgi:hypothetical protein
MSDSGRFIGQCPHGNYRERCAECESLRVAHERLARLVELRLAAADVLDSYYNGRVMGGPIERLRKAADQVGKE